MNSAEVEYLVYASVSFRTSYFRRELAVIAIVIVVVVNLSWGWDISGVGLGCS